MVDSGVSGRTELIVTSVNARRAPKPFLTSVTELWYHYRERNALYPQLERDRRVAFNLSTVKSFPSHSQLSTMAKVPHASIRYFILLGRPLQLALCTLFASSMLKP
jgi:hypothetical protein